jgi:hypothetical protein
MVECEEKPRSGLSKGAFWLLRFPTWNGSREIYAWRLVHEAKRLVLAVCCRLGTGASIASASSRARSVRLVCAVISPRALADRGTIGGRCQGRRPRTAARSAFGQRIAEPARRLQMRADDVLKRAKIRR